jgi:CheY-like chemotaxis protein
LDELFGRAFAPDLAERPERAMEFAHLFAEASAGASMAAGRRPRRIMVVDDDSEYLAYLCAVIESGVENVVVEPFDTAEELLEASRTERVDLIVSDLDMPQTDGHALTERLRGDSMTKSVPLIVLTASGSASDWQRLRDRGADAFLVKPVDPATLASTLERALERAKSG